MNGPGIPATSRRRQASRPGVLLGSRLLVLTVIMALAACAQSTEGARGPALTDGPTNTEGATTLRTPVPVVAGRPNQFEHQQRTFVDRVRKTPAGHPSGGSTPPAEKPSRTLVTEIYYPVSPGPRPLIMFSHGLGGHPSKFTKLFSVWAAAGYVVVAPAFPLTNSDVPGWLADGFDLWDQPRDISFVLDQVLAASTTPGDPLEGRVDPARLGAAGLSLGGATTFALGFNPCCRDDRFRAVEILSGAMLPMPDAYTFEVSVPVLIIHGDKDASLPYSGAVQAFGLAKPPKYLVTLIGGTHAPPYEDEPSPHDELVERATVDFWDAYLAGETDRLAELERDAAVDGLSGIQAG